MCGDQLDHFKDKEMKNFIAGTIEIVSPLLREFLEWDRQFSPELFKLIFKPKKWVYTIVELRVSVHKFD